MLSKIFYAFPPPLKILKGIFAVLSPNDFLFFFFLEEQWERGFGWRRGCGGESIETITLITKQVADFRRE